MKLSCKNAVVVGLGKSGIAVCRFLNRKGVRVTGVDMSTSAGMMDTARKLRKIGVTVELGEQRRNLFLSADMIIISPGVPHTLEPLQEAVVKGIPVIGEIELAARFISEPIIAITGTNGKTTTTTLLGDMLRYSGISVFVGGNIGNPLIGYVDQSEKADMIVAEISSFQLDTIERFCPKVAVLLNITEDHLDRYTDFRAYAESKGRIFKNQTSADVAIINGADEWACRLIETCNARQYVFNYRSGTQKGAVIDGNTIHMDTGQQAALRVTSPALRGKHNLENVAAASLAADAVGCEIKAIQAAIDEFKGLPHRLQYVDTIDGVSYFDDSKATNVDATLRAIATFSEPVVLIMGGRDKGGDYKVLLPLIERHVKAICVIGEAAGLIENAFSEIVPVKRAPSLEEAVSMAAESACSGDAVLLSPACASFDMFTSYAHRGECFENAVKELQTQ